MDVVLQVTSILLSETESLTGTWGFSGRINWLASERQGHACLHRRHWDYKSVLPGLAFYMALRMELRFSGCLSPSEEEVQRQLPEILPRPDESLAHV